MEPGQRPSGERFSARIGDRHLAVWTDSAQVGGDSAQRALRGGQPDALRRRVAGGGDQGLETLQGEGEVGSTLGGREGVHLVDDHVLHSPQHLPRLAREQQVEALRRQENRQCPAAGKGGAEHLGADQNGG